MASITPHGKKYRAHVAVKGTRRTQVFNTKNEALMWSIEQETLLKGGKSIIGGYTLADAFDRYAQEESPRKKGERWEVIRLKKLKRDSIAFIPIDKIERIDIENWIARQTTSDGSILRELGLIQSVMKKARRWRWTNADPFVELQKPSKPPNRTRTITAAEREAMASMFDAVRWPSKSAEVLLIFELAIETAMRKGEIISLTWDNVHISKRFVYLPETKNGTAREVPLSKKAMQILGKIEAKKEGRVFTVSAGTFDQLFRKLKKRAGVSGFTFHDTRRTGITIMASKIHVLDLAKAIGHKDPKSLMWYYQESATDIAAKLD